MNRVKFHLYTFVGSLPWCLGLAWVGQRLGAELLKETSPLKHFMHRFDLAIGGAIILAGIIFIRSRIKTLRAYREADKAAAGHRRRTQRGRLTPVKRINKEIREIGEEKKRVGWRSRTLFLPV